MIVPQAAPRSSRRSSRSGLLATAALAALVGLAGCARPQPASPSAELADKAHSRQLLCADVGDAVCLAQCPADRSPREHAECLLRLRFADDPEALDLATTLYARTNTLVGVAARTSIEGYRGSYVELHPALPIGEQRHHLEWLHRSLGTFDWFVASLAERAPRPLAFRPRPKGFAFFQTAEPSYPSAYCVDGVIAYNVQGLLHADSRDMHETLFHELFHINDAAHGAWSTRTLGPTFDAIVERCDDDHACLATFAPHDSVVPDGTFYAFDARTRDVREYAAELALRYFLEHEAILTGAPPLLPFKCRAEENLGAWTQLVDTFFGGADLTPPCEGSSTP